MSQQGSTSASNGGSLSLHSGSHFQIGNPLLTLQAQKSVRGRIEGHNYLFALSYRLKKLTFSFQKRWERSQCYT